MSGAKYLIQDNKIIIPSNDWFKERVVAEITESNKDVTIGFLVDKFEDLIKDANALSLEYQATAEKPKLLGKISRFKHFASNAKALGDYESLLAPFDEYEKEIMAVVDENIKQRLALTEKAEALKSDTRDWKIRTEELQNLSKDFKSLAVVPHPEIEVIRQRFEKAKDEFFVGKQSHFDDQKGILFDNLEHKIEICEKAEALANSTEWRKTTEAFNALLEEWKTVGPIPRHRSDELWLRFSTAKDIFFNNKKANFENIKVNQEENLKIKLELIAEAESIKDSKEWKKTTEQFNDLMKRWKETGRVSDEMNDEVWAKFIAAKDFFFKNKDAHYSGVKLNLDNNFAKKESLVKRAEELAKECNDYDSATTEIMEMTEEWKKTGRIAKEHGDELWERFNTAKKTFFTNKDAYRESRRQEAKANFADKGRRQFGYAGKLGKELTIEQEVLQDFKDRLKNLPASIRSFETKERYEKIIAETEEKISFLKKKIEEVNSRPQTERKDFNSNNNRKISETNKDGSATSNENSDQQNDKPKFVAPKMPKVKPIQHSPSIKTEVKEDNWANKLQALKGKFSE